MELSRRAFLSGAVTPRLACAARCSRPARARAEERRFVRPTAEQDAAIMRVMKKTVDDVLGPNQFLCVCILADPLSGSAVAFGNTNREGVKFIIDRAGQLFGSGDVFTLKLDTRQS